MRLHLSLTALALALASLAAGAQTALDQNKALAGGALPGDAPGFPITISQPGSYKLTGNLAVPANTTAIDITVPGVTLDMNGFSIIGPVKCVTGAAGATLCTAARNNFGTPLLQAVDQAVIRNGTVQGSTGVGINLKGQGHTLSDLTITASAGNAIARNESAAGVTLLQRVRVLGALADGVVGEYLKLDQCLIHGVNAIGVHTGAAYVNYIFDSVVSTTGSHGVGSVYTRGTQYVDNAGGWGNARSLGGNTAGGNAF